VDKAVAFYSKILGFGIDYLSGSPASYAVVYRDDVHIHLCLQETHDVEYGPGRAFIAVTGVDAIWEDVQVEGVKTVDLLADKEYGCGVQFRVFTIHDPMQMF
jgi:catechol 2,3-dioxygenase-like lactoylglutathione lyase family enzyme